MRSLRADMRTDEQQRNSVKLRSQWQIIDFPQNRMLITNLRHKAGRKEEHTKRAGVTLGFLFTL